MVALVACAQNDPRLEAEIRTVVDTLPSGRIVVANTIEPRGGSPPTWRAIEELVIPGEGGGPGMAGYIGWFGVHPDGELYTLEYATGNLRIHSSEGALLRTIPLPGAGPFGPQPAIAVYWRPDGALVIRNPLGYTIIAADGTMEGSVASSFTAVHPAGDFPDPDGWIVEPRLELGAIQDDRLPMRYTFYRISPDLAVTDSLRSYEHLAELGRGSAMPRPLGPAPVYHGTEDGALWFARSTEYRIHRRSLAGDTTLVVSLDAVPVAVSQRRREELARSWYPPHAFGVDEVSKSERVLLRFTTDENGRLFVFPNLEGVPAGTAADVFAEGVYLGRILLPVRLTTLNPPVVVRGERIYGVVTDEERGTARLVRFRIEGWTP